MALGAVSKVVIASAAIGVAALALSLSGQVPGVALGGVAGAAGPAATPHQPLFVGFYVGWDDKARASLAAHIGQMDVFAPLWVTLRGPKAEVVPEDDPDAMALLKSRRHPPRVFPIVSNAHDDIWDARSAGAAILDPAIRAQVVSGLTDLARQRGLSGYIFDFENLKPEAAAAFPGFLAEMKAALGAKGLQVWAVASVDPHQPLAAMARSADAVVLMGYDQCWANSYPGPVAGADWLKAELAQRLSGIDPAKVVVALASYGYDWPHGGTAKVVVADGLDAAARAKGATLRRDPVSGDATFTYTADGKARHEVWAVDAAAFAAQRRIAAAFHPKGIALWRLGLEDPDLWRQPPPPPNLKRPAPLAPGADPPQACEPLPPKRG